jgi:hypothetical protein
MNGQGLAEQLLKRLPALDDHADERAAIEK